MFFIEVLKEGPRKHHSFCSYIINYSLRCWTNFQNIFIIGKINASLLKNIKYLLYIRSTVRIPNKDTQQWRGTISNRKREYIHLLHQLSQWDVVPCSSWCRILGFCQVSSGKRLDPLLMSHGNMGRHCWRSPASLPLPEYVFKEYNCAG